MKNKKTLSLIVTAHNEEKYIERCLNSLILATSKNNKDVEIIISVNNSTDKTLSISEKYANKNDNIIIVESNKPGPSVARNFGIKKATGDFLTFIDGDDFVSEKLDDLIDFLKLNKEIDLFLNPYHILKNSKLLLPEPTTLENYNIKFDLVAFAKKFKLNTCFSSSSSKILKTEIIKKNNLVYNEHFFQMEDMLFGIEVLPYFKKFMFINIPYYHYEIGHESSLTKKISKDRVIQGFEASQLSHDYIFKNIKEKNVRKKLLQFSSLMSYSLLRRVNSLNDKEKEEVIAFLNDKKTILNYPHCFSTKIFYLVNKLFGLKFALKFL